jgi:hypothetical protein
MQKKRNPIRPTIPTSAAASSANSSLLDETIATWQPRASRPLTREDARQIIENMTGFFNVLRDWDRAERAAAAESEPHGDNQPDIAHCDVMLEETS